MENTNKWGVYYVPTKQAKIFTSLKNELVEKFNNQDDAIKCMQDLNQHGYIDDLHIGYSVLPLNN